MLSLLAITSALAMQAAAVTLRIDVGKNGLEFSPNSTTAAIGDVLEFHFYAHNHSVVQGRFDQPCVPLQVNPFYSGYIPANSSSENATVFQVTVASTSPAVYYCSQNTGLHCARGMYGVINPSGQNTLQQYGSRIQGNLTAEDPNVRAPFGGVYSVQTNLQTSSAPTTPATSPPTATPTATSTRTTTNPGSQATTTKSGFAVPTQAPVAGVVGVALAALMMV